MVSTHNILQARTFVNGKSIGIQTFVVQTRDKDLTPVRGVEAGDIGPKLGFQRVDNGFMILNNVQVPLENMLMKYVQVTPEGKVIGLENK